MSTVPFTEEDVKGYLDECIIFWRQKRGTNIGSDNIPEFNMAVCYVDAFQSVRMSLFGELLSMDEVKYLKEESDRRHQLDKLDLAIKKKEELKNGRRTSR